MNAQDLLHRLAAEGLSTQALRRASWTAWSNGPGEAYGAHTHDYDKVLLVTAGSITFQLVDTDRALDLPAGRRLDLPAGTRHAALVGAAGVDCLEVHLPAGSLARRMPGTRETGRDGEA